MDQNTSLLIGIDGGGTKTVALLADGTGNVLGRGVGGPSNYQVVGLQATGDAIQSAIRAAFGAAGLAPCPPRAICLGLAGVDRPDDYAALNGWARAQWPGLPVSIVNDAMLVLAAGTPDGWGIGVISGTGSIVYGRDPQGRMVRAGGWGHILGDEGSGFWIGLAALQAVARADDGRAPQTVLTRAILSQWDIATPQDMIHRIYLEELPKFEIAALAALVETTATEGDAVAHTILQQAGHELALAVSAVARRLELRGPIPCAQAGSTLLKGRHVRGAFLEAVAKLGVQLDPVTPVTEPALGALRLAGRLWLTK